MKPIYCFIAAMLFAGSIYAQSKKEGTDSTKHKNLLTIQMSSSDGLIVKKEKVDSANSGTTVGVIEKQKAAKKEEGVFSVNWLSGLDIGFNRLQDKTDYNSPAAKAFLHVSQDMQNSDLFNLRTGKSVNVNIWPVLVKYRLLKTKHQKIYLVSGAGLQLYNFSFSKPVTYTNNVTPAVVTESTVFTKNKLAFDYLSIPLQLTFKTKLGDSKQWLVYSVGVTGGYLLESWTKQVSSEYGKQKNHNSFNFENFNSCVTGEIGLDGAISLFASYQLTSLQSSALNQHPFSIGVRLLGL